eukprot:CAMPEP_0118836148 /NCGR_PEP_ID=MMETSP1162-20130426/57256_1 /TAXON_ID=33656 /ORGANISM="Phaeocystis Sp, Strain CCMP2710" /LENGTH=44 /DNA_ID= /DNA_START= /DNA_END= /DNA_ORIENTATION=
MTEEEGRKKKEGKNVGRKERTKEGGKEGRKKEGLAHEGVGNVQL